jgi:hypothetical protein
MRVPVSSFRVFRRYLRKLPPGLLPVLAVAGIAFFGVMALTATRAAGPFVAAEIESGVVSSPASKVTDSTASGGSAVRFAGSGTPAQCASGGTYLWSNLEACGWPGPADTGPDMSQCPNGLTNVGSSKTGSITYGTANAVISCVNVTGGVQITAKNVTIKNSKVTYDGGGTSATGVININDGASATIDHVETNGSNHTHACIWDEGTKSASFAYSMVAKYVNCYGINDGIFSWWWSRDANVGAGSDFIIQDSYFHDFTENAANGHIDGYQTEGASNGQITHNTYRVERAAGDADVSGGLLNSAIALWNSFNGTSSGKATDNYTVSNNLFTSGGFTIYAEDYSPSEGGAAAVGGNSLTNVHFTNNVFSTVNNSCVGSYAVWFYRSAWSPYFGGPTDGWNQGGSTRTGNKIIETGFNLDNGNPPGCS